MTAGQFDAKEYVGSLPRRPGVYRMYGASGELLYVGKARNLKSRVQNYAHPAGLSNRLRRMIAETPVNTF